MASHQKAKTRIRDGETRAPTFPYSKSRRHNAPRAGSVRGRSRERGVRDPDAAVGCVEDRVEALEEGHAVDEVEALAAGRADRADDEVHAVRVATDGRVQRALRTRTKDQPSELKAIG